MNLLSQFHKKGFISILVNFDIPEHVLQTRVAKSQRSTTIFRTASTFKEVLSRQHAESHNEEVKAPTEGEADHLFVINDNDEVQYVIRKIINIARSL